MRVNLRGASSAAVLALTLLGSSGAAAQQVVFLMRHAEQGPPPELALTEAGQRRATALAHRLKDAGITAIYATDAMRTQETVAPIARSLALEPRLVPMKEIDSLVKRIRAEHPHGRVLIVNHSLNIGPILKALGHPEELVVARDDYDPFIVIVPRREAPPLVLRLRL
jgi:broad specificity phosphatase PhoE